MVLQTTKKHKKRQARPHAAADSVKKIVEKKKKISATKLIKGGTNKDGDVKSQVKNETRCVHPLIL